MHCTHDRREKLLVIHRENRVVAEMWRCLEAGCGDYIGTKPMSVGQFLRDNPAPCLDVWDGSALAGIDAEDIGGPRAGHDGMANLVNGTMI